MKLQTLNEAMRFGSLEFRKIERLESRILVGVEYEFHVDGDKLLKEDRFQKFIDDKVDDKVQRIKDQVWGRAESTIMEDLYGDRIEMFNRAYMTLSEAFERFNRATQYNTETFHGFMKLLQGKSHMTLETMRERKEVDMLSAFGNAMLLGVEQLYNAVTDAVPAFKEAVYAFRDDPELHDFMYNVYPNKVPNKKDAFEGRQMVIEFLQTMADDMVDTFENVKGELDALGDFSIGTHWDVLRHIDMITLATLIHRASKYRNDIAVDEMTYSEVDELAAAVARDHPEKIQKTYDGFWSSLGDVPTQAREELVASYSQDANVYSLLELVDYDFKQDSRVQKVTLDVSVEKGVELITEPLELNEAMKFMEEIFEYISKYGGTSMKTGMHVNMSVKGMPFRKDNFDPVKVIMLLDEEYLRRKDDTIIKYPVRDHVDKILNKISFYEIVTLANRVGLGGSEDIIDGFKNMVRTDPKYQTMTFRNTFEGDIDERRIEFRFFGGSDYEKRYNEIRKDIYRSAYAVVAGFNPKFAVKEYRNAILRYLNLRTRQESRNGEDFVDVLAFFNDQPDANPFDVTVDLREGNFKKAQIRPFLP